MAKSRPNRKRIRQIKQKQSYEVATQVRLMAERLPNQGALRTMLLQEPDPDRRLKLYSFIKPFLKFPSTFPSPLDPESRIIAP